MSNRTTCDHCGGQAVIRKTARGALCDMHHKRLLRTGTVLLDPWQALPPPPGPWIEQASCRGSRTASWFPERGGSLAALRAVCAGCPVRQECGEYALDAGIRHGVWGGLSERQRIEIRRERGLD